LSPPAFIEIAREVDVVAARLAAGELAAALGFTENERHCIVISVSELAANIVRHAGAGVITLRAVTGADDRRGLEVLACDQGGGIADIGLALQDGYSTAGGLGCGLPGVQRLMSELHVASVPGAGTTVRALKWIDHRRTRRWETTP